MGSAVAKESVRWSEKSFLFLRPPAKNGARHRIALDLPPRLIPSVRVGTLGREKATLATAIRLTGVSEQRGERAGDRHGRERDRRRQRGLISLFLQTAGRRRIETHHAQRRQGLRPGQSFPLLSPLLRTTTHVFSLSFVPLAACRPGRARELSAHAGDGGWVREILTRKPFESPDVANLRRASSGRSPLRCGEVSLRAMRRGTLPATSVGIAAF